MAERHTMLPATQVAGFKARCGPVIKIVWKIFIFAVTLRRGHILKHCIEIVYVLKICSLDSKGFPSSLGTGNTAFKGQLKLVNIFER
jgi:hypothetical protein